LVSRIFESIKLVIETLNETQKIMSKRLDLIEKTLDEIGRAK